MKYLTNEREIDIGTRNVRFGSETLHVEPQVFDLILYLIENRGRVVDKDELLARIWKGRIVSEATIASRLNAARKVLGDDGRKQNVIKTYSRQGFRFMSEVVVTGGGHGRPAVAVLPFSLIDNDTQNYHLARGLADQLAAALGQAAWFDVKDTAASFAKEFTNSPPSAVAERLGVGYLVLGNLRTHADGMRLDVRLVDASDERQVWTGSLQSGDSDVFEMQDRLANQILGEIEPRLRKLELRRSETRHGNFSAFDHYLRASDYLSEMTVSGMRSACIELDKAVEEYPDYGAAHGMRAWVATLLLPQGQRVDAKVELERSRQAVAMGAFDCDALAMGGYSLGFFDRHPLTGLEYVRRALAINPSSARAHDHAGWLLLYSGSAKEALRHFERGLTLCPLDEFGFRMLTGRAFSKLFLRDFKGAISDARRAHAVAPQYTVCHRVLAASLASDGQVKAAGTIAKELRTISSGISVSRYSRETRFEGTEDRQLLFSGLRLAGLK